MNCYFREASDFLPFLDNQEALESHYVDDRSVLQDKLFQWRINATEKISLQDEVTCNHLEPMPRELRFEERGIWLEPSSSEGSSDLTAVGDLIFVDSTAMEASSVWHQQLSNRPDYQLYSSTERTDDIFLNMLFKEDSSNSEISHRPIPFENPLQDIFSDLERFEMNDSAAESLWHFQYRGPSMSTDNFMEDEETECVTHSCVNSGPSTSCLQMADGVSEMHQGKGIDSNEVLLNAQQEKCLEAGVLQELENIITKLSPKTRICFRDTLYVLAQNSMRNCKESTNSCIEKLSTASHDGRCMSFARSMSAGSTAVDEAVLGLMFDGKNCSLSDLPALGITHKRRRASTNAELQSSSLRRPSKLAHSDFFASASGKNMNSCQL